MEPRIPMAWQLDSRRQGQKQLVRKEGVLKNKAFLIVAISRLD